MHTIIYDDVPHEKIMAYISSKQSFLKNKEERQKKITKPNKQK